MYVYRRPGLEKFLQSVSKFCELWVYTAAEKEYADAILNSIDLNGLISKRFYRDVSTCIGMSMILIHVYSPAKQSSYQSNQRVIKLYISRDYKI